MCGREYARAFLYERRRACASGEKQGVNARDVFRRIHSNSLWRVEPVFHTFVYRSGVLFLTSIARHSTPSFRGR